MKFTYVRVAWWRHQMETFSAFLVLCGGNPPVTGGFPSQRPVTRSFGVFFDLSLNKRLSKQPRRRWFETPSRSLWRHSNGTAYFQMCSGYIYGHWAIGQGSCMVFIRISRRKILKQISRKLYSLLEVRLLEHKRSFSIYCVVFTGHITNISADIKFIAHYVDSDHVSRVLANERRRYICNVFSHWPRPCSRDLSSYINKNDFDARHRWKWKNVTLLFCNVWSVYTTVTYLIAWLCFSSIALVH